MALIYNILFVIYNTGIISLVGDNTNKMRKQVYSYLLSPTTEELLVAD